MNTIDIRTGKQTTIEAIRFADGDYYQQVAISNDCGDLAFHNDDDLNEGSNSFTISKSDIPNFFASIRKGIELGWFPPFEPVKTVLTKKPVAKAAAKK